MTTKQLPNATKIEDKRLADAVLNARIFWLAEWSDVDVSGLIKVIDHILSAGRRKFPAFANDDLLTLTENLERQGSDQLAKLIAHIGRGPYLSGLALLAAANDLREDALLASAQAAAVVSTEAAGKWHTYIGKQSRNGRVSVTERWKGKEQHHEKVRAEIQRLREAGHPEHNIASTLAKRDGMPSASTIRDIRKKMPPQEK